MNANTTPLEEVIPWSPSHPRTILVCDSIETDGGFVLSTMIAQLFSSHPPLPPPSSSSLKANATRTKRPERRQQRHPQTTTTTTPATSRALWLSGKASTERQVASDLKKLGCDAGAAYLKKSGGGNNNNDDDGGGNRRSNGLSIRSLALEIADRILDGKTSGDENDDDDGRPFDSKEYLQSVYDDVKEWVGDGRRAEEEEGKITDADSASSSSSSLSWIVLDDVTALASMLGDTLVYCFVESLITLIHRRLESPEDLGLILRCSGDVDQMLHRIEGTEGTDQTGWFGAGGLSHREAVRDALRGGSLVPWERAIEESVDAIVDVLPLPSGFSREAHGRLILSETPNGRGWKDAVRDRTNVAPPASSASSTTTTSSGSKQSKSSASGGGGGWNKLIFNYRLQDNGARAIRLRAR